MADIYTYDDRESGRIEEPRTYEYSYYADENNRSNYGSPVNDSYPGSPNSVASDCSYSSSATASSCGSSGSSSSKPLRSALRRTGESSTKGKRNVHWDPDTVFETRPWSGKRVRPVTDDEDTDTATPPPVKKPKFAEQPTTQVPLSSIAHQPIQLSASVRIIPVAGVPIFPEASRIVLPSFNFSCVENIPQPSSSSNTQAPTNVGCGSSSAGKFVPFSFANQKRKTLHAPHSHLPVGSN